MAQIIQGTTPTIKYTFDTVDVSEISTAYLTIKQNSSVALEKELEDATVGTDYLSWTLTQAETLALSIGNATIMLNWKTSDGTRGASARDHITITSNDKDEVI